MEKSRIKTIVSYAFLFLGVLVFVVGVSQILGADERIFKPGLTWGSEGYAQSIHGMKQWGWMISGVMFSLFGMGCSFISIWGIISAKSD